MTTSATTRPAIHPGEILAEELAELAITPTTLARQLSVPPNRITQIIHGRRNITGDTALRLGHWFGTNPQFWLNLQAAYDLRRAEQERGPEIARLPKRAADTTTEPIQGQQKMYRKELPRVYELRDMAQTPPSLDAYFQDFDNGLRDFPPKLKYFRDIEKDLQVLDVRSWEYLKKQLLPIIAKKDAGRGWQALFDKLNEAKGYNYLVRLGCLNVEFIPTSPSQGQRTPDLRGDLNSAKVLCEIKTINASEMEIGHRVKGSARGIYRKLSPEFFKKLAFDLKSAKEQLDAFCSEESVRKISYIIVNFDDSLHEYVEDYAEQIRSFVAENSMPGIEVAFDMKPPFYSAMI